MEGRKGVGSAEWMVKWGVKMVKISPFLRLNWAVPSQRSKLGLGSDFKK